MSAEKRNLRVATGFPSLRNLQTALPCTKMGMFRQILPEIEHLLRLGHRSKAICDCLRADGLDLGYDAFRVYLRRARRSRDANRAAPCQGKVGGVNLRERGGWFLA